MRQQLAGPSSDLPPLAVDLHPDRPIRRGHLSAARLQAVVALMPDPSFEEIRAANGEPRLLQRHEMTTVDGADRVVWVSGEIERVTRFERGIVGGIRWEEEDGKGDWYTDEVSRRELSETSTDSDSSSGTRDTSLST